MKRREAIAGGLSLGVLGTGTLLATRGIPSFGRTESGEDLPQLDEPVEVRALSLPWSDDDSVTVPATGSVTVYESFATSCNICERTLSDVTRAYERTGPNVEFVSVTAESIEPEGKLPLEHVTDWWTNHGGGEWPIGADTRRRIRITLKAPGTPTTAVFDSDGVTRWIHRGAVSTEKLLAEIEAAGGEIVESDA